MCLFIFGGRYPQTALFAGEAAMQEYKQTEHIQDEKRFFPAVGNVFLSNFMLYMFNRYVGRFDFSMVSLESIQHNLRSAWVWDQDVFMTNQLGHPYQGSTYFTAGRANGFGFYESMPFAVLGSVMWELFHETEPPSLNDLFSTTLGGITFGEMLHRIYLEMYAVNSPFAMIISPMDAWSGLITGGYPRRGGGNIYRFSISSGIGITRAKRYTSQQSMVLETWRTPQMDIACHIIYGNPFEQRSVVPYNHFELALEVGDGLPWYTIKLVSDAYLFSFSPINQEQKKLTTGLTMHSDLFASSNINFFSEALDWTLKSKRSFHNNLAFEVKAHLGLTVFGTSDFYSYDPKRNTTEIYRDYGTGSNLKLFFSLAHPKLGTLALDILFYHFFIISHNVPNSSGVDSVLFTNISYRFPLGKRLSLGVSNAISLQKSDYTLILDIENYTNTIKLYAEWNF
jgi:hypothetical protein